MDSYGYPWVHLYFSPVYAWPNLYPLIYGWISLSSTTPLTLDGHLNAGISNVGHVTASALTREVHPALLAWVHCCFTHLHVRTTPQKRWSGAHSSEKSRKVRVRMWSERHECAVLRYAGGRPPALAALHVSISADKLPTHRASSNWVLNSSWWCNLRAERQSA